MAPQKIRQVCFCAALVSRKISFEMTKGGSMSARLCDSQPDDSHNLLLAQSPSQDINGSWFAGLLAGYSRCCVGLQSMPSENRPEKGSAALRKGFKKASLRWHPDKFSHRYGDRLDPKQADFIMQRVMLVSQQINAEWQQHSNI